MLSDVRAELLKATRRPATWLLVVVAVTLGLLFNYVVPYVSNTNGLGTGPNAQRDLESVLPGNLVGNSIAGSALFVGALALIFGVLAVGSEYAWSTWKTVVLQGVTLRQALAAKVIVLLAFSLAITLSLFLTGGLASALIAIREDVPMGWPSASELGLALLGGWLVTAMWGSLGVLLAVGFRSVAMPIGLGLVWLLAVQNLVATLAAPLIDWVDSMQTFMPGPNAGSLIASLGGNADTPGVVAIVAVERAATTTSVYLLLFTVAAGWLLGRRDIA
ncbi:ABC transporter permease [Intrasporangium sp.]|uniref:ABC transporter permease n=1 Tax=Intrasporangium sp. TaxID=1925024 RepID=UPI0029397C8F|nr:ABC transporter permease [Intrasporangium sp.]MDV3220292.1 ABC transporter permease [Intrasporangium sp.]